MGLVKNVGNKLESRMKSGDINEADLMKEASEMLSKMKNMPGMDAISLLENMGFKVNFKGIGKVKSQSIKRGSELKEGDIIKLELS